MPHDPYVFYLFFLQHVLREAAPCIEWFSHCGMVRREKKCKASSVPSVPSVPFAGDSAQGRSKHQGFRRDDRHRSTINSSRLANVWWIWVRSRHRSGQDRARATGAKYRAVIPTLSLQMLSVAIMERFKIRSFVKFFPHYLR